MKSNRRSVLGWMTASAASTLAFPALAATNPPASLGKLRIFIPANPGGGWDATGHAVGDALVAAGQASEIGYENKGGKGGIIGLAQFVETHSDAQDAVMVGGFVMVGSIALNRPAIDLSRVKPIARLTSEVLALVVPIDSKFKTVKDFQEALVKDIAAVPLAGGGAGGVDHMCAALVARAAGANPGRLNYVPSSSGAEVMQALAEGKVLAAVSGFGELKSGITSGKLRALAISSRRGLFGIPSFREQRLDVELSNWRGVFAPSGMSDAQVTNVRNALQKATQHPSWQAALVRNDWQPSWQVGTEFAQSMELDKAMADALVYILKLKAA